MNVIFDRNSRLCGRILGLAAIAVVAASTAAVEVTRVRLGSGLSYVTSAVWSGDSLIALDLPTNSFHRIDADGDAAEVYRGEEVPMSAIGALPGRPAEFLVKFNNPDEWQSVKLGEGKSWSFQPSWVCADCSMSGVNWAALDRDRILAVGEVKQGGDWQDEDLKTVVGIYWVGPDGPDLALELPGRILPLYLSGQPYVAVAGGKGYAIVPENLEEGTGWLQIVEMQPFNRGVRKVVRLPARMPPVSFVTVKNLVDQMKSVSDRRIPVALLSWQERLFLIDREFEGFMVWEIEPATGMMRFLNRIEGNEFVTIIPGRNAWAVLEKGPVVRFGKQQVQGLSFYPAEFFSAP